MMLRCYSIILCAYCLSIHGLNRKLHIVWRGMSSNELERKCAWELVVVVSTAAYNRERPGIRKTVWIFLWKKNEWIRERERVMVWEKGEQRKRKNRECNVVIMKSSSRTEHLEQNNAMWEWTTLYFQIRAYT